MERSKVHTLIVLVMVAFFTLPLILSHKLLDHEELSAGKKNTEEPLNLSKVKPLNSMAYLNRSSPSYSEEDSKVTYSAP